MRTPTNGSVFDLPAGRAAKADPALIERDEQQFAAIADCLRASLADLQERLDTARHQPSRSGPAAFDRDAQVHRLSARLRHLRRFGLDMCLGRIVDGSGDPVYIGRIGLTDGAGRRLLADWRSPAAEPFFAATRARPMGLVSRRRFRWTRGRISDYWDEVFTTAADGVAPDDESAFLASLGAQRSDRMRDVLGTIRSDQDAIIRAPSPGTLVVDGGPGTGKTVVALHRTAYLLYHDPRLDSRRGGVLFLGPSRPYLTYVGDVLPSLGEEGVQTGTLSDLVPEGGFAATEADPRVAALKSGLALVDAVEEAVRFYEEPPTQATSVATPWAELRLEPADWAEAFATPEAGTPHNEAREEIHDRLIDILVDGAPDLDEAPLRRHLRRHPDLVAALHRAWPMVEPTDLVGDLWSVPAYLRRCAPGLAPAEIALLQRAVPDAWTGSDLPLLDAARHRLGDAQVAARQRRDRTVADAQRTEMDAVVADLIAADDSELQVMKMLHGDDLRDALVDPAALTAVERDALAGPFAHVVVDEAQELTDAQWRMILRRCPSGSLTVVGDRAQARHGFAESWAERLERVGFDRVTVSGLTINYRTPEEVMAAAAPVIRAALPDATVPTSIRRTGVPVEYRPVADLPAVLDGWLAGHADGMAAVIGDPAFPDGPRVRSLTPGLVKGLEFDLVLLVRPRAWGGGIGGAVDRYVAMTRTTARLVVFD